jgi:carbon storage regulator
MLVLSRKPQEAIEIEGGITVRVLEVRGDKVSIGIDAPSSIRVHRKEVADAIKALHGAAGDAGSGDPAGHELELVQS